MNTSNGVVTEATKSKKGVVAGFIVAFASILCASFLSVSAFAGEAGESAFETLFNHFNNPALADSNENDSYQYESLIISDSSGGESIDENATYRSVTVHFTNNYISDAARRELAEPQVLVYEDGQAFNFEVALADNSLGAPRKITLDEGIDLSYVIGNDNNHVLFSSDNGITENTDIDVRYGNEVEAYKILRFYQGSDGDWRDDAITEEKTGEAYSKIPSQQEIDDGLTNHPGFVLDTYDNGVIIPGITSMVSIYYARLVNTVVFDDNGGANGPGTIFARSGNEYNLSDKVPTRAGYDFKGWWTEKEGGEELPESQYAEFEIPTAASTTYYAHWELQDSHIVTVVYWGENANDTNYGFISEAYFSVPKDEVGNYFTLEGSSYGYAPRSGAQKTLVENYDTDGDGQTDHAMTECFNTTEGVVAPAVEIEPGQYTVYNVYLKRVQYTWEYYSSITINGYNKQQQNVTWGYGSLVGKITAKWGQDISADYIAICKLAYDDESATSGRWVTGVQPNQVENWRQKKDRGELEEILIYKGYVSNMELVNRVSSNTGLDNSAFGKLALQSGLYWSYYCQKINGGDAHSTSTEIEANYDLVTTIHTGYNTSFTEDEWINIDGFITPSKTDGIDAPYLIDPQTKENTLINGQSFFYKRVESPLYLYYVDSGLGQTETSDTYFRTIGDFDYQTPLAEIPVPENMPGSLKDASGQRVLGNFIPNNPKVSGLDENYVFAGWGLNPLSSETIDITNTTMPDKTYSLYAKWVAPTQTVTFYQVSAAKTEDIASSVVLEDQTYNTKLDGDIPEPTYFNNFYFLYWYYYVDEAAQAAGQRTYFDPLNSPVPAQDIELFPEYSSLEPNTEYLVSPVNKPEQFHGSISPDSYFYVKSKEKFTKADEEALEIMDMDGETLHSITPTPAEGYEFDKWQLTYGDASEYHDIVANTTAVENVCGVKAVFKSTSEPEAAVVTPPKSIEGLQYNGEEQVIATDGVAENGTMQYIVNQSSTSEEGTWKDTIDKKTDVGTYYVHYYAKGNEGVKDSAHGTIQCSIGKMVITVKPVYVVKYINPGEDEPTITGPECFGSECDAAGFEHDKIEAKGNSGYDIEIKGKLFQERYSGWLTQYSWYYDREHGFNQDNVEFIVNDTDADYSTLYVTTGETYELEKPTWKQDIPYDGKEHNVSVTPGNYWENYYSQAMDIGGDLVETEIGGYYATFTLHEGFNWVGEEASVRTISVRWRIVGDDIPVVVPTWKQNITYDGNPHDVSATTYWNGYDTNAMTIGGEELVETDPGTYTATFTLKPGYIWDTDPMSTDPVDVDWTITEPEYIFVDVPEYIGDITYDGNEHDVSAVDFWENFSTDAMTIGGTVKGTEANIYTATFTLKPGYAWQGQEITVRTADVEWFIKPPTYIVVDKPTWKQDIPYDGEVHNVSTTDYWNSFNTDAMTIGGVVEGTAAGTYTATFTLKDGFKWSDEAVGVRSADVNWKIVEAKVKVDNPFTFNPEHPWVLENDSILVKLENVGDAPTFDWGIASGDNIEFEVTLGRMAVINGLEASETDAVISVTTSETENYKETTKTCPVKVTAKEEQKVDVTVTEGLYVDEFGMIQVTGIQEKPDMTWDHESGDEAIQFVSVTSTYVVNFQGIAGGTEKVKLVLAETEHFAETVIYVDVTILPKVVDELSFAQDSYEVSPGGYIDITVDGLSAERTNYSWEIVEGDGKIALSYTKNNPVRVNGLAQGTAKIKITAQGSIKYTEVSAETTIEVSGKPQQNVTLNKNELNLMQLQSDSVRASGMLETPTITWSIEDEEIATITSSTDDNDVTVKGLAVGETKLVLELGETATYAKTTKEVTVKVTDSDTYYLAERGVDYRGIMEDYNAAASVRFSPQDDTVYSDEYLNVDIDHAGLIKAYKVRLPEYKTYSIVVASPGKIAFSGMTGASLFRAWKYLLAVDFSGVIFDDARSYVRMFNECNALKTISTEETGLMTSSVTDFRFMFAGCEELTNITLGPSFIVKPDADISSMFASCTKLDAIFVEPGTDWTQGTGPSTDMFANCPKLISQTDAVDRTKAYIGAAFTLRGSEVKYLLNRTGYVSILDTYKEATSVVFSPLDSKTYSDEYINVAIETDAILAYKVPDTDDSYHVVISSPYNIGFSEHTGDSLFAGFAKLTSVDFGDTKFDKVESFVRTFNLCTSLKTIDINWTNLTTSKVTDYRFMFSGCSNLEQIMLGDKFIVSDEADVSNMFRECPNLMSIVVPVGTDWSKGTAPGDEMFFGCSKLVPFGEGIDREKAYVGPGGYFVDGTAQEVAYLVNRSTTNLSIFNKFIGATSFEFKVNDTTAYSSEFIDVATDGRSIRAYKVKDGDSSYHVVVTTGCNKISTSASSCAAMFWGFSNLRSVDFGDVDFTNATSFVRMFNSCNSLQTIKVNWSGLVTTNVTDYRFMFCECSALTSIDLSDKFVVRDDALLTNMFAGCSNLKNIYAPSGTDWSKGSGDGTDMFNGCSKLVPSGGAVDRSKAYVGSDGYFTDSSPVEAAWLNNRPSSNVSIFEAYKGATSFEFKVEDSTEYSSEFINVSTDGRSINAYKINDNDGSYHVIVATPCKTIKTSATSCAAMFWGFTNLASVNFGSVDFTDSTSFVRMFNSCYKLQTININWTGLVTSNVTDYKFMFYDCTNLTSITLSNKFIVRDDAALTNMFAGCSKLDSICVPAGTDWSKGTGDGTDMFSGCSKLVPAGDAVDRTKAYVGSGGYFTDGTIPTVAYLKNRPSNNYSIIDEYKAATSVVFKANDSTPYSTEYINVATDGRSIKAYKVTDSDGSYHVVVASPCSTIKSSSTSCAAMFWGFSNLVSVDFGSLDFTGVTSFVRMFNSCSKLQAINVNWTGLNTSAISDYKFMFYDCRALTKITFGTKFIVRDDADLSNMFENCSSLTTIVVPDGTDWSKGTGAGTDMFLGCSKLVPASGSADRTNAYKGEGGYFS